jgi:ferredoxin
VAYTINPETCLKCGVCIDECPEHAIVVVEKVTEYDGLNLYTVNIDPKKCTDCAVCVSHEWWCPAKAIAAA